MVVKGGNVLLWYFIALWFCAEACLPWVQSHAGEEGFGSLSTVMGYAGYAVLGYALSQCVWRMWWVIAAAMMAAASWWVTASGTYSATEAQAGVLSTIYYELLSWNMMLLSASSFVFVQGLIQAYCRLPSMGWQRFFQHLSATSFGVYLIHPLFMGWLASGMFGVRWHGSSGSVWLMVPCTALATYALSHATVWLMRQVPWLKLTVP